MLRFLPLLLMLGGGYLAWQFSVRKTLRELNLHSTEMVDAKLLALCEKLAEALGVRRVTVRIYEVQPVNGLAAPDGQIFITRGFYERYRSGAVTPEEMAGVIAHELGHVALGHSRRRMIDFTAQNAMRAVLIAVISRVVPGIGARVADLLTRLLSARLSRQDEYEADAYGAALLAKAGIGAAPQISLLRKLGALAGEGRGPAWLMSHPDTRDRIAALERLTADWPDPS
ncbi:MAG: M48 family metallopeptidase [Paracoccaceae bacterium]|nr:M48 family metallopeptidase [Paracoccaceae bacterium]